MKPNDLNTALYEKMAAEQDNYRDWLKSQPPEEILHHTYEYTVREDIVMAMEELELTDAQAQALLKSPSPLADVYRYFEKLETGYMDVIRDSIGKVGFGLGHSITLLYKIKSQTISIKADHLAVETYLIFAVQANLNRKYTVFLFRVEVTMVFLNDTVYIF